MYLNISKYVNMHHRQQTKEQFQVGDSKDPKDFKCRIMSSFSSSTVSPIWLSLEQGSF